MIKEMDSETVNDGERLRRALQAVEYTGWHYGCDEDLILPIATQLGIDKDRLTLADGDGAVYLDRAYCCSTEYESDIDARPLFEAIEYLLDHDTHSDWRSGTAWATNVKVYKLQELLKREPKFDPFDLCEDDNAYYCERAADDLIWLGNEADITFEFAGASCGWVHIDPRILKYCYSEQEYLDEVGDPSDIVKAAQRLKEARNIIWGVASSLFDEYESDLQEAQEEAKQEAERQEREPGEAAVWAARGVVTVG